MPTCHLYEGRSVRARRTITFASACGRTASLVRKSSAIWAVTERSVAHTRIGYAKQRAGTRQSNDTRKRWSGRWNDTYKSNSDLVMQGIGSAMEAHMNTKHYRRQPCTSPNRTRPTIPPNASPAALHLLFVATMRICDEHGLPGSEVRLV